MIKDLMHSSCFDSNNEYVKDLLYKKMKYRENDDMYKLFKNMYVRKNLISKDHLDLKALFSKFIPDSSLKEI
jgi:hypothetical protein